MTSFLTKTTLSAALAATAIAGLATTPAQAEGYRGGGHGHGDATGVAVAAGIFGLALGAIIASNHHHEDNGPYVGRYYRQGWEWRDGYYWDHDGNRFDREGRRCDGEGDVRRGYSEQGYRGEQAYRGGNDAYRGEGYYRGEPNRGEPYQRGWRQGY